MDQARNVVFRIEDGMDRRDVYATTYQMRNFFKQLRDALPDQLDVFNYIQHHQIALWCKPRARVLDVCCGRGLMLPLLRYHATEIDRYVGVDLEPANATFLTRRVTDGKRLDQLVPPTDVTWYYPFKVHYVEADAAAMAQPLIDAGHPPFDVIIYTSALEHMNRPVGQATLEQCRQVVRDPGGVLVLTTPVTAPGHDGYDCQYRAHVYEWSRAELDAGLADAGWKVHAEWGLHTTLTELRAAAEPLGLLPFVNRLAQYVPTPWLTSVLAPAFPGVAHELALMAVPV
jgi:SAM-dependent methyltransferase